MSQSKTIINIQDSDLTLVQQQIKAALDTVLQSQTSGKSLLTRLSGAGQYSFYTQDSVQRIKHHYDEEIISLKSKLRLLGADLIHAHAKADNSEKLAADLKKQLNEVTSQSRFLEEEKQMLEVKLNQTKVGLNMASHCSEAFDAERQEFKRQISRLQEEVARKSQEGQTLDSMVAYLTTHLKDDSIGLAGNPYELGEVLLRAIRRQFELDDKHMERYRGERLYLLNKILQLKDDPLLADKQAKAQAYSERKKETKDAFADEVERDIAKAATIFSKLRQQFDADGWHMDRIRTERNDLRKELEQLEQSAPTTSNIGTAS